MRRKFWETTSREKKIEMLRHASEARLTMRETAILLEAPSRDAVNSLAARAGISFEGSDVIIGTRRRAKQINERYSISFARAPGSIPPAVDIYLKWNS